MRCPSCKFVCSELRDICPRCLEDLRHYKKSFGLPITKPEASYKELLQKAAVKRFPEKKVAEKTAGGLRSFLRGLFKEAAAPASSPGTPAPSRDTVSPLPERPPPHPQDIHTSSLKVEAAQPVAARPSAAPQTSAPEPSLEACSLPETERHEEVLNIQHPVTADFPHEQSAPEEENPSFDFSLQDEEPAAGELSPPIIDEAPDPAPPFEEYPDAFSEKTPAVETPPPPPPSSGSALRALFPEDSAMEFARAFEELSSSDETLEFSLSQLRPPENTEEIKLLFELCHDFVENPAEEQRYISRITTSEDRKIEARALEIHLKQLEQQLSTPLLRLSAFRSRKEQQPAETARSNEAPLPRVALAPAPLSRRVTAFTADASLLVLGACLAGFAYAASEGFFHFRQVTGLEPLELIDLIPALAVAGSLLFAGAILYPLFAFLFFGRTIGMRLARTVLLKGNRRRLDLSNLLVRTLVHPLSLVLFGYLPLMRNRRSLHDYLARTELFVPASLA